MKNITKKAFTLVELLVVITILAIISVVAYQSFGGATSRAIGARKISDVSTIETGLQMYKSAKGYYPPTDKFDATTNRWGFNSSNNATKSNKITVQYNGQEIDSIKTAEGGGKITNSDGGMIGAKGTISQKTLGKQYLSKDLYDPELGDTKVGSKKMIDEGIGRYVYAIYKKGANNTRGNAYNIAYTVKKDESDLYMTKIVGDYDAESCYEDKDKCPPSLIGPGENSKEALENNEEQKIPSGGINTGENDQGIPYPISDFTE